VRDFHRAGFKATGFDGNPETESLTEGMCGVANLAFPQQRGAWDWVMSLEVAEHIPPQYEDSFVENIVSAARKGVVLSWGNQAGHGHFNCRSTDYVVDIMRKRGLHFDAHASEFLRQRAALGWFKQTLHVFHRKETIRMRKDY